MRAVRPITRIGRGRAAQRWRRLEKKEWRGLWRARLGPADSGIDAGAGTGSGTGGGAEAVFGGRFPVRARNFASFGLRARKFELEGFPSGGGIFAGGRRVGGGCLVLRMMLAVQVQVIATGNVSRLSMTLCREFSWIYHG